MANIVCLEKKERNVKWESIDFLKSSEGGEAAHNLTSK